MIYVGKLNASVTGVRTGNIYFIERGKPIEIEDGDIPGYSDMVELMEKKSVVINEVKVETASVEVPKRGRKPNK